MHWYREPMPPGRTSHFAAEVVAGLLDQITERRCPTCERLTGYAHADWTAPALLFPWCGMGCWWPARARYRRHLWGFIDHAPLR